MTEEKVHGGVQFGVNFDGYYHPKINYHNDTVGGEEYQEEGDLQLWVIGEAQESNMALLLLLSDRNMTFVCQNLNKSYKQKC